VALLRAQKALDAVRPDNHDQAVGVSIIRRALEAPARQIAENAGREGSVIVAKIRDAKGPGWGYDAQNDELVDLVEGGIIDSTKVVRIALQDAASVAGLLITTEAMVAEAPQSEDAMPAGAAPGMGAMGGMGGMGF
jgi:chaperonin GroEL